MHRVMGELDDCYILREDVGTWNLIFGWKIAAPTGDNTVFPDDSISVSNTCGGPTPYHGEMKWYKFPGHIQARPRKH